MTTEATATADAVFRCAKCRAGHPWAAEHAGKTARCACGNVLKVPAYPEGGPPPAPRSARPAPPPLPAPAADDDSGVPAFLRMPAAVPVAADDQIDAATEAELAATGAYGELEGIAPPDPARDLHAPLALLVVGAAITFFDMHLSGTPAPFAMIGTFVKIGFWSVVFMAGALVAAKFAGIYLGRLGPALLKIPAVSVAPAALGDLVTKMLGGDMAVACVGGTVAILACWGCVSYLFRLSMEKTLTVVGSIAMVKLIMVFLFGSILALLMSTVLPGGDEPSMMDMVDAEAEVIEDGGRAWAE